MRVYTYSEARQQFATVLDKAELSGKVIIRRKDGKTFALSPEQMRVSPLNVPSIKASVSTAELVEIIKTERGRARGRRRK